MSDTSGDPHQVTRLLVRWGEGDEAALKEVTPLIYERLHQLAESAFRNEYGVQTLQPTAVVNEAWVQLAGADLDLQSRDHFYALAARMMRRILVNHALARKAAKRGGGQLLLTLEEGQLAGEPENEDVLHLHDALEGLVEQDPELEKLLELRYFGGYTAAELAEMLDASESTVKRRLRFARAWLRRRLEAGNTTNPEQAG